MRVRWAGYLVVLALAACSSGTKPLTLPVPPAPAPDDVRFLEQSTFGPSDASIGDVQRLGQAGYLDAQLAMAPSSLGTYPSVPPKAADLCPAQGSRTCVRDHYTAFPVEVQFFRNALSGPDQLRQRVAFALSQIFVVSAEEVRATDGIASYEQMLLNDAFGNIRQLLADVTLSPAMGRYLNMVNNDKPSPAAGTAPNENYGRELLQLFSIGLVKLNADGSPILDGTGQPVPTYGQDVVEGFSHVFTGWTFPTAPGAPLKTHNPILYTGPMVAVASNHDSGAKTLLDGHVLPAGQSAQRDLDDALDVVFQHPNLGPFLGRQLIQHLVTSNPSPAYVARISAVFANDGTGVRGSLGAVIRAILLDPEARGSAPDPASAGKLREPALFIAGLARILGTASDGVFLHAQSAAMEQEVYTSPTVFNFYPPDQPLQGSALVSPPSAIFDSTTALLRANFVERLLSAPVAPDASVPNATGTSTPLSAFQPYAADPSALLSGLDGLLLHGTMTPEMRGALLGALSAEPDLASRVYTATYLVASSTQYQVQR